MIPPNQQPTKNQIRRNYVVGAVCIAAFSASSFAYTLPGLTAKASSLVVGYWAALPFVHLATGHGFGFKKKKRAIASGGSSVDGQYCGAEGEDEQPSQAQIEVALGDESVSTSRTPSSPSN